MKKGNLNNYMLAVAFIVVGVMLALDWLDVDLFGLHGSWVAILLLLVSLLLTTSQIIQRSTRHIFTPTLCGVIGLMLLLISVTDLAIDRLWPMIPLGLSLGVLLASLIRDKVKLLTELGFVGLVLSLAFLVGTLFSLWNIVFPVVLILGGVVIILRTALKKENDNYEIPSVSIKEREEEILGRKVEEGCAGLIVRSTLSMNGNGLADDTVVKILS